LDRFPVGSAALRQNDDEQHRGSAVQPVGNIVLGARELEAVIGLRLKALALGRFALDLQQEVADHLRLFVPKLDVAVDAGLDAAGRVENVTHRMDHAVNVSHAALAYDVATTDLLHASSA